jgi:hypothetical protein
VRVDLLVFVEDPGAANWIVALQPALAQAGFDMCIVAAGAAGDYLRERGIEAEPVPVETTPAAADALLDKHDPRMIVVGTSENLDTLGLALITQAHKRGLRSLAFVDQVANAEHRFRGRSGNPLAHAPDIVLLPSDAARDAFAALGFPAASLIVTGNPHHDRVIAAARALSREGRTVVRSRVLPGLPADLPLIVFLSEIGYVVNPEGGQWERKFTLAGRGPGFMRGQATYRTAVVLEEVLDALAEIAPRPLLVVRLHPKNARNEFTAYAREVDAFSTDDDPLALVFAADLVIGMTTALLEEAHIMGRPTLAVLPRAEEREWLEALREGRITAVCKRAAIVPTINRLLATRAAPAATDGMAQTTADAAVDCIKFLMQDISGERNARL